MNTDLAVVLILLAATTVMFALNRPRMDAVALIMMTLLPLTGVISPAEALSGLSDPNVVLIGALFVLGEGLVRTGVAQKVGDLLVRRAGKDEARLIVLLMAAVTAIGTVMSSTGVVAIFLPSVLRIARNAGISPRRLLMPLSVAALISGMTTLIATPPNLIVHGQLIRAGHEGFRFFDFTRFGVPVLVAATAYMVAARRWLSPDAAAPEDRHASRPRLSQWIQEYDLAERHFRLRLEAHSPWAGKRLGELDLRRAHGIDVLAVERRRRFMPPEILEPGAQTVLEAGDILFVLVRQPGTDIAALCWQKGLVQLSILDGHFAESSQAVGMAELMIPAASRLIGQTVVAARFRSQYKLSVIGLKRGTRPVSASVCDEPLKVGDTLLVAGPWRAIARLRSDPGELVVLNVPAELDDVVALPARAPFALLALAVTVGLMVFGVVPNVVAALIGCLLLGLFRCIDMNGAYRAIQWPTLFLIVGMIPFSIALEKSGGVAVAARVMLEALDGADPVWMLVALYLLTVLIGLFVSNTATAVLVAPVAVAVAGELGLSPYPFAMAVALASSTAFLTPVSSPVNALVAGPGNYTFADFVKVGLPLSLLVMAVNIVLIRLFLPF
ncbi:MAG: SLC13 family permease [Firmicutes bacterium]|nr:SLC13 family permease [Bacillota bacterium]MBO2521954.1 SLC13 family permease [Bacillota bacterium]